jgi:uncharacterized membrane protein YidH (DUF202 family)
MNKQKKTDTIDLAKMNTLLSNQRTYFSYIRSAFALLAIAIASNNYFILLCGILILVKGGYQYDRVKYDIINGKIIFSNILNMNDILFVLLIGYLYYWYYSKDINIFKILKKKY